MGGGVSTKKIGFLNRPITMKVWQWSLFVIFLGAFGQLNSPWVTRLFQEEKFGPPAPTVTATWTMPGAEPDAADDCVKNLLAEYRISPGSTTGLAGAIGRAKGFAYSIELDRNPDFDEDDATLKREADRLRRQLKDLEKQIGGG